MSYRKKITAACLIALGCFATSTFAQTNGTNIPTPFAEKGTGAVTIGHLATVCASDGGDSQNTFQAPITYFCCVNENGTDTDAQWMPATAMRRPGFVQNTLACPPHTRDITYEVQARVCTTPPAPYYNEAKSSSKDPIKHELSCTRPVRLYGWVDKTAYQGEEKSIVRDQAKMVHENDGDNIKPQS